MMRKTYFIPIAQSKYKKIGVLDAKKFVETAVNTGMPVTGFRAS
jgi:hypothetical protein